MFRLNKNNLLEWAVLLFAFFPIIPNNFKWVPVVILLIVSLFHFKKGSRNYKWFLLNASLYIFYVVSIIYTNNLPFALKKLETTLSLLVLPFIFYIVIPKNILNERVMFNFIKLFVISCLVFSIIAITVILTDTSVEYYKDFYSNRFRILVERIPYIGQHPIYASIFQAVALIFISHVLYSYKTNLKQRLFLLISAIVSTVLIVMLSSKGVIISLIILIVVFSFRQLLMGKNKKKVLISIIVIVSVISLLFIYNRRMNEMIKFDTYGQVNSNYSNSYRINIYKCASSVIKEKWLFGYGIGDAQDVLNSCYESGSPLLLKKTYNSHNLFLDIWIKTGILSLLMFLAFLFLNLKKAFIYNNYILISILLFFILNFMTENILSRQSGIILFSFLINFLGIIYIEEK